MYGYGRVSHEYGAAWESTDILVGKFDWWAIKTGNVGRVEAVIDSSTVYKR